MARSDRRGGAGDRGQQQLAMALAAPELAADEADVQLAEAIAKERDEEITAVSRDALELKSLFEQVAGLVSEQGEGINQIEHNVDEAHGRVRDGVNYLIKAEARQLHKTPVYIPKDGGGVGSGGRGGAAARGGDDDDDDEEFYHGGRDNGGGGGDAVGAGGGRGAGHRWASQDESGRGDYTGPAAGGAGALRPSRSQRAAPDAAGFQRPGDSTRGSSLIPSFGRGGGGGGGGGSSGGGRAPRGRGDGENGDCVVM